MSCTASPFCGGIEIAGVCTTLVAVWQLVSFFRPLAPSHIKYKRALKTEPVNPHKYTHKLAHTRRQWAESGCQKWRLAERCEVLWHFSSLHFPGCYDCCSSSVNQSVHLSETQMHIPTSTQFTAMNVLLLLCLMLLYDSSGKVHKNFFVFLFFLAYFAHFSLMDK